MRDKYEEKAIELENVIIQKNDVVLFFLLTLILNVLSPLRKVYILPLMHKKIPSGLKKNK